MTVTHLLGVLKTPREITYAEVVAFWTRIKVRLWCVRYTVYLSPNGELQAWTNDIMQQIALLWNRHTGQVHQANPKALYELFRVLGGWI